MEPLTATVPITLPPSWAVQERRLIQSMEEAVYPFLDWYTRSDGEFIYDDRWGGGADDFYEPYFNWPLLYLMGGGDQFVVGSW